MLHVCDLPLILRQDENKIIKCFLSAVITEMGMTVDVTSYQDAFSYFDKVH